MPEYITFTDPNLGEVSGALWLLVSEFNIPLKVLNDLKYSGIRMFMRIAGVNLVPNFVRQVCAS